RFARPRLGTRRPERAAELAVVAPGAAGADRATERDAGRAAVRSAPRRVRQLLPADRRTRIRREPTPRLFPRHYVPAPRPPVPPRFSAGLPARQPDLRGAGAQ